MASDLASGSDGLNVILKIIQISLDLISFVYFFPFRNHVHHTTIDLVDAKLKYVDINRNLKYYNNNEFN